MNRMRILAGLTAMIFFGVMLATVSAIGLEPDRFEGLTGSTPHHLYRVELASHEQADVLEDSRVEPVLRMGNEYLFLASSTEAELLREQGIQARLIRTEVRLDDIGLLIPPIGPDAERYPVLYETGGVRLVAVASDDLLPKERTGGVMPVRNQNLRFEYVPESPTFVSPSPSADIDSVVNLVRLDSLTSYVLRLQAFNGRVSGTDSAYAARDWLVSRFTDMGYDSVFTQEFTCNIPLPTTCYNVVCVKPGLVHPDVHVVVGAHYDGVEGSPAADDNGSGTSGVLELARVLSEFETDLTVVFVAFDAEEWGLIGSWEYVDRAVAAHDDIMFMLNMDMIGDIDNTINANISVGSEIGFASLWEYYAHVYSGLSVHFKPGSGSDAFPFEESGFPAAFLAEYEFSDVYHTPADSVTHLNPLYMTAMVKVSAATIFDLSAGEDYDVDGVANSTDNCPTKGNAGQSNSDGDALGDICDNCPDDTNSDQFDDDHDNIGNACDLCPNDAENDWDRDGFCAGEDNCPHVSNAAQVDTDLDGVGDLCQCCQSTEALAGPYRAMFGWQASCDCDINNDGYDDIVIGARQANLGIGAVYVYSGKDMSEMFVLNGYAPEWFGFDVECSEDLNGDGFGEIIVGAVMSGRVYIYSGEDGSLMYTLSGATFMDGFGSSVTDIPDIDGDWIPEVIVGAMNLQPGGVGQAFVFSGEHLWLLYTLTGESGDDWFGALTTGLGNIDGDGVPDFAVSAIHHNDPYSEVGRLYVYSGASGSLIYTVEGTAAGDGMGGGLSALGDINDDGIDDFLVGAPQTGEGGSGEGYLHVISGATGTPLRTHTATEESALGWYATSVGDQNQDGYNDYAVSAPRKGAVTLYSGQTGEVLKGFWSESHTDYFGHVMTSGDLNADGSNDLLVTAYKDHESGTESGAAYVYLLGDPDSDGIDAGCDNCPMDINPGQEDSDADGAGDACDICPGFDDFSDIDGDTLPDGCDNCPEVANADQEDLNGNLIGDACESCCGFWTEGYTGNANCGDDGKMTLSDVSRMIDYLYISKAELCCPATGNTNGSEDCKVTLSDISRLIDALYISKLPTELCMETCGQ